MKSDLNTAIKDTAKHGIVYGIGTTLPKAVAVLLLPVFARYLTPEEFGIWALLQTVTVVSESLFVLGLDTACLRFYHDCAKDDSGKKIVGTTIILLLLVTMVFNLVGQTGAAYLSAMLFKSDTYFLFIRLIVLSTTFKILNSIPFVVFRARKESKTFIAIQTGSAICRLVAMCLTLIAMNGGILGLLLVDLSVSLIATVVLFALIWRDIKFGFDSRDIKNLLQYGLPVVPGGVFYAIIENADRYILSASASLSAVGVYFVSMKISQVVKFFLSRPFQLIFPAMAFSIDGEDYSGKYYARILTHFLYVGLFLCLGISLFSKEILLLMGKQEYLDAQYIIPVLLLAFLLDGIQKNVQISIFVERKTLWVPFISGGACALNIGLNLFLIERFGIYGAALSILITRMFILCCFYMASNRYRKASYEWSRIGTLFATAFGMYGVSFFLARSDVLVSISAKSILLVLFPVTILCSNFHSAEEKRWIMSFLKRPLNVPFFSKPRGSAK